MDFQFPLYAICAACLLLAGVLAAASVPSGGKDLRFWVGALLFVAGADFAVTQQAALGKTQSSVITAVATSLGLAMANLALQEMLARRAVYLFALAPVLIAAPAPCGSPTTLSS